MKKMKLFNIIMSVLIFLGGVAYLCACIFPLGVNSVVVKTVASALFVATGLVNLCYVIRNNPGKIKFPFIMFAGLLVAFVADVLLDIEFIVGAAFFAFAHIVFFIAYCCISKINWKDLLFAMCVFVPSLSIILFVPIFTFEGIMQIVCVTYALIISFMVGKAINNYTTNRDKGNLIVLIGSCLFFFSDMMLLFSNFGGMPICSVFCLITYYPAEFLLAYSILKK